MQQPDFAVVGDLEMKNDGVNKMLTVFPPGSHQYIVMLVIILDDNVFYFGIRAVNYFILKYLYDYFLQLAFRVNAESLQYKSIHFE